MTIFMNCNHVYSRRSVNFYFDIFIQNTSSENKTTLVKERQKRVKIKALKACMRLVMLIACIILVSYNHQVLSTAKYKYVTLKKHVVYKHIPSIYTWSLFVYIVTSLVASIVVNLIEVVQYMCTGTTWIDWILHRSVLIHSLPLDNDEERNENIELGPMD